MQTPKICLFVAIANAIGPIHGQSADWPETFVTLEEKVDALAGATANGNDPRLYLISLGPEVVPIITQRLRLSLAEESSATGARALAMLDMPQDDQKRANSQIGLVGMLGIALREMALDPAIRKSAVDALYSSLKSPYIISRKQALYTVAKVGDVSAVDEIIPLLNDANESNRVIAAQMLAKIGDASTAKAIEATLERRRQGLTAEQQKRDWSFRHGYEAINLLKKKGIVAPINTP